MAIISRDRIRLPLDSQNKGSTGAKDEVTAQDPRGWRATDLQFELGFFFQAELVTPSNFDAVILTIKNAADRRGPILMQKTVSAADINQLLTQEQWDAGTGQHCVVAFTQEETALDLGGEDEAKFFLSVVGITSDVPSNRVPLGTATFILEDDGTSGNVETPAMGSSVIPLGQPYNGGGTYTLTTVAGVLYQWVKAGNDTSLTNGAETLTGSGYFTAAGASVTLTGTALAVITAVVRKSLFYSAAEVDAKIAGLAKIINLPGVNSGWVSENGQFIRLEGITNEGMPFTVCKGL